MFIHTLTDLGYSSGKQIVFCDRMMSMSRKGYASLAALPSLFARSTRDFESQTIYISTHCLTCSHDHENLFEWRKLLNPEQTSIKTMTQLSTIEMKSRIEQEMDCGFKVLFSTNREAVKSNESQHSIFERAREKKAQKRSMKREKVILLDLSQ